MNLIWGFLSPQLLEYVGKGKSIVDVGLAQARRPLNTRCHYYELEIADAGEKCYIALGLARRVRRSWLVNRIMTTCHTYSCHLLHTLRCCSLGRNASLSRLQRLIICLAHTHHCSPSFQTEWWMRAGRKANHWRKTVSFFSHFFNCRYSIDPTWKLKV